MKKIFLIISASFLTLLPTQGVFAVHGTACTGDAQCTAEPDIYCIYGLGVCAPIQAPSTCLNDASCTSSLKPSCNTQTRLCEQGSTQVCPTGQVFNVNENKCVATDKSCPSGYYFDDNTEKCQKLGTVPGVTECSTTQPCSDTKKKCINNVCVSPEFGECVSSADCATGLICQKGQSGQVKGTCVGTTSAPEARPWSPIAPTLQIPIPTLKEFKPQDVRLVGEVGDRYVEVPFIARYIVAVYKYGISIAFIVSIVMIMIAGFRWMTAGGNTSIIGQAKNMIATTVIGMILLLGSYVLLNTVNPDLLKAGVIRVKYIEQSLLQNLVDNETEEATEQISGPREDVVNIKTEFMGNSMLVAKSLEQTIQNVAQELFNETKNMPGGPYRLSGGGYRELEGSPSSQVELWAKRCEGKPTCVPHPTCNPFPKSMLDANGMRKADAKPDAALCPHTTGVALDLGCARGYSKKFYAPCQRKLEEIMLRKGFCRLTSEPWHFERPNMSGTCTNISGRAERKATKGTWDYSTCNSNYNFETKQCA